MSDDLFGALLCTAVALFTFVLTIVAINRNNAQGAGTCGFISGAYAITALTLFSRL